MHCFTASPLLSRKGARQPVEALVQAIAWLAGAKGHGNTSANQPSVTLTRPIQHPASADKSEEHNKHIWISRDLDFGKKSQFCHINATLSKISQQTQYLITGFILDFKENVFRQVWKMHLFAAGSAGAKKVCFQDLNKDIFLEVQNETCS